MRDEPNKHHRRSIRLRGYDYAAPGAYFVTICVQGRQCLFGAVVDGELLLNDAGRMVRAIWDVLPERFPALVLDATVVMPNHFHTVVMLREAPERSARLGDIVGAFKSLTTNAYIHGVRDQGWPPFDRRLWQRNYYERIIRDDQALARIRDYIQTNPVHWERDQLHPLAVPNHFNQE